MLDHSRYFLEDLEVGMTATFEKTVSESDVIEFASISGDNNPLHLDADYAAGTMFGERIAHGMLTASLISAVIATFESATATTRFTRTADTSATTTTRTPSTPTTTMSSWISLYPC